MSRKGRRIFETVGKVSKQHKETLFLRVADGLPFCDGQAVPGVDLIGWLAARFDRCFGLSGLRFFFGWRDFCRAQLLAPRGVGVGEWSRGRVRAFTFWCGYSQGGVGVWSCLFFPVCFESGGYVSTFSEFSNIGESVLIGLVGVFEFGRKVLEYCENIGLCSVHVDRWARMIPRRLSPSGGIGLHSVMM